MRLLPEGNGDVEVLAYSADGAYLAASARPGPLVWLWDLRADERRLVKELRDPSPLAPTPPNDLLAPLAYSRSGDLAFGGERQVSLRDSRTGVSRYFLNVGVHQSRCLAFAPDGQTLVSAGVDDDGARRLTAGVVWDIDSGGRRKLSAPFPVGTEPLAVTWDASLVLWCEPPSGRMPGHLTLWHIPGRRPLARLSLNASPACATFSPSGRQFALDVGGPILVYEIGHVLDYFGAALGADPWASLTLPFWWKRFAARLPPLGPPKELEGHPEGVRALAYAPDGTSLFSGGRSLTVRRWDLASLRSREAWSWPVGPVSALAVAPDGMTAAAGGSDGRSVIWDLTWF